jgi:hypothetical protein
MPDDNSKPWDEMSLVEQVEEVLKERQRQGKETGGRVLVIEKGKPTVLNEQPGGGRARDIE